MAVGFALTHMSLRGALFWRRGNLLASFLSGSPRPQGARDDAVWIATLTSLKLRKFAMT